jgi:hypothetical protein
MIYGSTGAALMSVKQTVQHPDLHNVELVVNVIIRRIRVYVEVGEKNYRSCNDYSVSSP